MFVILEVSEEAANTAEIGSTIEFTGTIQKLSDLIGISIRIDNVEVAVV